LRINNGNTIEIKAGIGCIGIDGFFSPDKDAVG
jgi:hypothetical protein